MSEITWFLVVAGIASAITAWKAFDGFAVPTTGKSLAWWVHQVWFNFAGAFVGWTAAWVVGRKLWTCLPNCCDTTLLKWPDAALAFLAFVGITGHLPFATMGLIQGIVDLAKSALGLLKK